MITHLFYSDLNLSNKLEHIIYCFKPINVVDIVFCNHVRFIVIFCLFYFKHQVI